jgi:hypothetical protein
MIKGITKSSKGVDEPIPINAHNELSNDFDSKKVKRSCGDLLG